LFTLYIVPLFSGWFQKQLQQLYRLPYSLISYFPSPTLNISVSVCVFYKKASVVKTVRPTSLKVTPLQAVVNDSMG